MPKITDAMRWLAGDDDDKRQVRRSGNRRHPTGTTTLTFAKPYCSPARGIIEPVLQKYGVKMHGYDEEVKMIGARYAFKNMKVDASVVESVSRFIDPLPTAQVAKVTVNKAAAAWAEYLLLRTNKLYRIGGYVDKRNERWAAQHGGRMPPAWNDGEPWIERSCSEGVQAWQGAQQSVRDAQKPAKKPPAPRKRKGWWQW